MFLTMKFAEATSYIEYLKTKTKTLEDVEVKMTMFWLFILDKRLYFISLEVILNS